MDLQKLYSYTRKAIYEYNMIEDGDKIAIGISGGKDSLTLLYALAGLRRFYPKKYELVAITVKLGLENMDFTPVKELCDRDDLIETFYMSLMYEGRIHTFSPVTYMDKSGLTLIRPLMLIPEYAIKSFSKRYELPIVKNQCPADGYTKRQYIKDMLHNLSKENPGLTEHSFTAIINANLEDWPKRIVR